MGLPAHRPRPPVLTWRDHLQRLDFWLPKGRPARYRASQVEKEAAAVARAFRAALCAAYGLEDLFRGVK